MCVSRVNLYRAVSSMSKIIPASMGCHFFGAKLKSLFLRSDTSGVSIPSLQKIITSFISLGFIETKISLNHNLEIKKLQKASSFTILNHYLKLLVLTSKVDFRIRLFSFLILFHKFRILTILRVVQNSLELIFSFFFVIFQINDVNMHILRNFLPVKK